MKIELLLLQKVINTNHLAVIPNFYINSFECDLFAMADRGYTIEYEIKKSKADFNNDFKKAKLQRGRTKHEIIEAGERTNRFYFVVQKGVEVEIPEYAGLIVFEKKKSGWVSFEYIKRAPLLKKEKVTEAQQLHCLKRLSWRNYEFIIDEWRK